MLAPKPPYQNSAGRLLGLLRAMNGFSSVSAAEALCKVEGLPWGGDPADHAASFSVLHQLQSLYLELLQDLQDHDMEQKQRDVLLSGLDGLLVTLHPRNLESGFGSLGPAEEALLEVCASTILPQEAELQKVDLDQISDSIATLKSQVDDVRMSPTLRKVLLDLIRLSEDAISRYHIRGARGLRAAFKAMLAETVELYEPTSRQVKREGFTKSPTWEMMKKHMKLFDTVAARLLKYKPLLEGAKQLFLDGPGPNSEGPG